MKLFGFTSFDELLAYNCAPVLAGINMQVSFCRSSGFIACGNKIRLIAGITQCLRQLLLIIDQNEHTLSTCAQTTEDYSSLCELSIVLHKQSVYFFTIIRHQ